ncbi:hypothetical protein [Luteimonas sp. MC1828]|uniref:hypothetical protein n=1 Tax=Luteimonas sp. MC1828 TaxID=2799787 RepID=UPI0018F1F4EA|nr:hypothetical protein [Luteimonas sp. MC1828]MBJ7574394.1 hypothetical protein [Luteimonas sp. MC1828]
MKLRILTAQNIAVSGVAIWATAPTLAYGGLYRIIVALLVLIWFALEAGRPGGLVRRPTRRALLVLAYILCLSTIEVIFGPRGAVTLAQLYIFLFFFAVYESRRREISTLEPVFWCVVATLPVWMYKTYGALQLNPGVARMLVRDSQEALELSSQGVGGYGLVYLSVLLMPVLVSLVPLHSTQLLANLRPSKARTYAAKLALFACIVFGLALIASAGYSIALYSTVLGVSLSLAFNRSAGAGLIVRALVVMVCFLIVLAYLPNILQKLLILMDGTLFEKKISDLLNSLQATSAAGTLGDRVDMYSRSVESFVANPVFGSLQSGGHSAVLDQFGRYGLFIGILFVWILFFVPLRDLRAGGSGVGVSLAFMAAFVPVTVLNTLVGAFGIAVYVMFPVAATMIRRKRPSNGESGVGGVSL